MAHLKSIISMKNSLLIVLLLFVANAIHSQDLIVTDKGDSINCKITKVKPDIVYFTFKYGNEVRSTLLPVSNIKAYQIDFYQTSEVPPEKIAGYQNYQHFRLALNGGFSYETAKVSDKVPAEFEDYIKQLKSGYHLGGDFTYYFNEFLGAGVRYSVFKTKNSLENIYLEDSYGNRTYGRLSDDLTISFIGPSFSSRFINRKNNSFLMSVSLGYMDYKNNGFVINRYKMTGNTAGFAMDIGYDIRMSENLALGFQLSLLSGFLVKYDWQDATQKQTVNLEKGEYESLNRIDFSIGLRFNK